MSLIDSATHTALHADMELSGDLHALIEARPAGDTEAAIASAMLRCVAQYGLSKTTVADIARIGSVSRATIYRLYPGGKESILFAAIAQEVVRFIDELYSATEDVDNLESCIVQAITSATVFMAEQPALKYMREHEPALLEQVLGFERRETLLHAAGIFIKPLVARFVPEHLGYDIGVWGARLVISKISDPTGSLDLSREEDVRLVVRTFMLPGIDNLVALHPHPENLKDS